MIKRRALAAGLPSSIGCHTFRADPGGIDEGTVATGGVLVAGGVRADGGVAIGGVPAAGGVGEKGKCATGGEATGGVGVAASVGGAKLWRKRLSPQSNQASRAGAVRVGESKVAAGKP